MLVRDLPIVSLPLPSSSSSSPSSNRRCVVQDGLVKHSDAIGTQVHVAQVENVLGNQPPSMLVGDLRD